MKTKILLQTFRHLAAILALASFALPARAALLVHDGFDYTGDLIPPGGGAGQGSGLGWGGPWASGLYAGGFPVIPTSLIAPTVVIPPTGGSIQQTLVPLSHYHASRFVQEPLTINPGESLWFSAIVSTSAEPGTQTYVVFTFHSGVLSGDEMRFEQQPQTSGGPLYWKFAGGSSSFGPLVEPNAPTLLVAEIHRDAPVDGFTKFTFRYWVNPSPASVPDGLPSEPPVATQITFVGFSTFHFVALASIRGSGAGDPSVHGYDEIRIGTAYADINAYPPPVNHAPVAVSDLAITAEDASVNIPVLDNDSDEDGDTLAVSAFTQGANGSVTLNLDGTLNYTPSLNFNGTDSFTYTVSDGVLTTAGTVLVSVAPVNDAPLGIDDSVSAEEDTAVTLNVLANDSDVEGDALAVESLTQGAHGTVILNPDGSVTYQPEPNFNGNDAFAYTVSDGQGGTTTATVNVTVSPVNDPPVASDGSATGPEDASIELVLLASDADGDALTFSILTAPLYGTVSALDGNRVIYTPVLNFTGDDSLTFRASDGQASSDAVVRLTIGPLNDPPTLGPVSDQTVNEGAALTFQLTATDPEGDTLTFSAADLPPGAALNPATGEFSWTPDFTQAGTYSVTFTVTDPSGGADSRTISIVVVDVPQNTNSDPDCSRAVPSVSEIWPPNHKQAIVIDILGVTDADGDSVSITITKILQDEPTNTLGDGSTWVDGGGIGTARAWVRAERSGTPKVPGNGRVYEIFFTVSDGRGGTCSSSVKVGVPHDQDHGPAIDDGVRYDSTVAGGPRLN